MERQVSTRPCTAAERWRFRREGTVVAVVGNHAAEAVEAQVPNASRVSRANSHARSSERGQPSSRTAGGRARNLVPNRYTEGRFGKRLTCGSALRRRSLKQRGSGWYSGQAWPAFCPGVPAGEARCLRQWPSSHVRRGTGGTRPTARGSTGQKTSHRFPGLLFEGLYIARQSPRDRRRAGQRRRA